MADVDLGIVQQVVTTALTSTLKQLEDRSIGVVYVIIKAGDPLTESVMGIVGHLDLEDSITVARDRL